MSIHRKLSGSRVRFPLSRRASIATIAVLMSAAPVVHAGKLLDYIRDYDLNNYALGLAFGVSQNPYLGTSTGKFAYPYLTSFRHSAFTDDWLLIRGENMGIRFTDESGWEIGLIGRIQTLGLGADNNLELLGLDERRWSIEAGPILGWRRWPVHVQLRSYWEIPNRHEGTTSEIEFSLPTEFRRGFVVPAVKFSYLSSDYAQYYFGVASHEATPSRPEYRPGDAVNSWVGVYLGYQLSEQWLLKTSVGVEWLDSVVTDSPIVNKDRLWSGSIGLAYNADIFQPRDTERAGERALEIRVSALSSGLDIEAQRFSSAGDDGISLAADDLPRRDSRETLMKPDAYVRIGTFHRLEIGFVDDNRRSSDTIEQDLQFGDQEFVAGTELKAEFASRRVRFAYAYSLMRDAQKELGVTAGLTLTQLEVELADADRSQVEKAAVDSLLPTMGIFGSVSLGSTWKLGAELRFFALDFDRYNGYSGFAGLTLDRKIGDAVGLGFGYDYYGTRLNAKDEDLRGTLRLKAHGPRVYLSAFF